MKRILTLKKKKERNFLQRVLGQHYSNCFLLRSLLNCLNLYCVPFFPSLGKTHLPIFVWHKNTRLILTFVSHRSFFTSDHPTFTYSLLKVRNIIYCTHLSRHKLINNMVAFDQNYFLNQILNSFGNNYFGKLLFNQY